MNDYTKPSLGALPDYEQYGTDKHCKQACSDCNLTLEECRNLMELRNGGEKNDT